jgi:predicted acyl esterase
MTVHSSLRAEMPPSERAITSVGNRVPMRDGTSLHAAIWRPRDEAAPVAAVLELTPYGIDHLHPDGVFWATNGFAYVAIDVRGRGDSDGDFVPFLNDAIDGYDAVEWAAAQPWCDGKVALHGGSYTGINQYLIMAAGPPALAAITPDATTGHGIDLPRGGIPSMYELSWRRLISNRTTQFLIGGDVAGWHAHLFAAVEAGTSLVDAAAELGAPVDEHSLTVVDRPEPGPTLGTHARHARRHRGARRAHAQHHRDVRRQQRRHARQLASVHRPRPGSRRRAEPPRDRAVGPHGHPLRRGQGG